MVESRHIDINSQVISGDFSSCPCTMLSPPVECRQVFSRNKTGSKDSVRPQVKLVQACWHDLHTICMCSDVVVVVVFTNLFLPVTVFLYIWERCFCPSFPALLKFPFLPPFFSPVVPALWLFFVYWVIFPVGSCVPQLYEFHSQEPSSAHPNVSLCGFGLKLICLFAQHFPTTVHTYKVSTSTLSLLSYLRVILERFLLKTHLKLIDSSLLYKTKCTETWKISYQVNGQSILR